MLGADGARSCLRKQPLLCGGVIDRASTGDAAFRIIIPCSQMRDDPDIEALISEPAGIRWMPCDGLPDWETRIFNLVFIRVGLVPRNHDPRK